MLQSGETEQLLGPGDTPYVANDAGMLAGRIRAEQDGKLAQSFVVRDDRVESKI